MYSTCIHCTRSLGQNEVMEAFPVGRRLAFDPAKGRLWVICSHCRRWNLTPLEERWEAVESCEEIFRTLRTRVHTDQIGAAVHPEGLRLIRIGDPIPVEFALWRYGETMGQRARRYSFYSTIGIVAGGLAGLSGVLSGGFAAGILLQAPRLVGSARTALTRVTIHLPRGEVVRVAPWKVDLLNPEREGELGLRIKRKNEEICLYGWDARRAAAKVMPFFNRAGAHKGTVQEAVDLVASVGGAESFLEETWGKARPRPGSGIRWVMSMDMKGGAFGALPVPTRCGLEMALNEEQERRALEGELAELKAAWREAEAIARISDDLLIPGVVRDKLEELKQREESG